MGRSQYIKTLLVKKTLLMVPVNKVSVLDIGVLYERVWKHYQAQRHIPNLIKHLG